MPKSKIIPTAKCGKNYLRSRARRGFAYRAPGRPLGEAIKLAMDSPTPAEIAQARKAGAAARDYFD